MRIGIDGHVLGKNVGGVERFVRELVQRLPAEAPQHEYIVFVTKAEFVKLNKETSAIKYVALASANPLLERLILLPWLAYRYRLDALLVQRLAPWFCGKCKLIATIHDITPIKFKDSYQGLSNTLVRLLTKNTIKRASLILTPTNAIKAEITQYAGQAKAPIAAFYNGVDTDVFKQVAHNAPLDALLKQPYLLTVGAIESRKNLETLFAMLPMLTDYPQIQLGVVGGVRDRTYYQTLQTQIANMGLSTRIHHFGFLQERELISLYQQAAVFISSSRDEGFNIPPLEAMACGVPVVCSDIAVHQELFAGAALFYSTEDAADLAEKVKALLASAAKADSLRSAGYAKVGEFTWQRTAKNVAKAIDGLGA